MGNVNASWWVWWWGRVAALFLVRVGRNCVKYSSKSNYVNCHLCGQEEGDKRENLSRQMAYLFATLWGGVVHTEKLFVIRGEMDGMGLRLHCWAHMRTYLYNRRESRNICRVLKFTFSLLQFSVYWGEGIRGRECHEYFPGAALPSKLFSNGGTLYFQRQNIHSHLFQPSSQPRMA